ncbi:hypothetical protein HYW44_01370 [Candidatus Daviesbacteria bacterium]|nr:hypothetical protein [Candidatus Daviesbacteria bacterium]
MARKFKKHLAPRIKKTEKTPVLSVELIRKESLEKIKTTWKGILTKLKNLKLAN